MTLEELRMQLRGQREENKMSNLSDIGFHAKGDEGINEMIMSVLDSAKEIRCDGGFYLRFSDSSGAELFLQGNASHEMIGFNPHFSCKSRRKVALLHTIVRDTSELDGAFHAVANPDSSRPETGEFEFVFDVPDFRLAKTGDMPHLAEIELTAFGSNDFKLFDSAESLVTAGGGWSEKSFVPPGLTELISDPNVNLSMLRPIAKISGIVVEHEVRKNSVSGNEFNWLLVETVGGCVDVVIDPVYVPEQPRVGQVAAGHFWLSGRFL